MYLCVPLTVTRCLLKYYSQPVVVAWVRHEERLLFQRFPEVVYMDFTASTTQEKRPLYQLAFKTSFGEFHYLTYKVLLLSCVFLC